MPITIQKETKYTIELKMPTLGIDKKAELNDSQIADLHREMQAICEALTEVRGAITIPTRKPYTRKDSMGAAKLMEYAREHTDFTIKNAAETLGMAENSLYTIAARLEKQGLLKKEIVGRGMAHIYSIAQSVIVSSDNPIAKSATGEKPKSPEREKMESLH